MKNFRVSEISILNTDSDSVKSYLKEINRKKYNPITREEEEFLIREFKHKNCQKSFIKILNSNLRFVVSVAKTYQNNGMGLADLINEGNSGLIIALNKFDNSKGYKFISYAVHWIRQSIIFALSDASRTIRLPLNKVNAISTINKTIKEFEQEHSRQPTTLEIAKIVKMKPEDIQNILDMNENIESFDKPVDFEEDIKLGDTLEDLDNKGVDINLINESLSYEIKRALKRFKNRDREILKMYFGIGYEYSMDNEQIARKVNLHHERVRQIVTDCLKKLKGSEALRSFLD